MVSATVRRKEEVLEEANSNALGREEISVQVDRTSEVRSFDNLAIGLADGALTRGQALKVVGGAILGTALGFMAVGFLGADEADARGRHSRDPRHHRKKGHRRRV